MSHRMSMSSISSITDENFHTVIPRSNSVSEMLNIDERFAPRQKHKYRSNTLVNSNCNQNISNNTNMNVPRTNMTTQVDRTKIKKYPQKYSQYHQQNQYPNQYPSQYHNQYNNQYNNQYQYQQYPTNQYSTNQYHYQQYPTNQYQYQQNQYPPQNNQYPYQHYNHPQYNQSNYSNHSQHTQYSNTPQPLSKQQIHKNSYQQQNGSNRNYSRPQMLKNNNNGSNTGSNTGSNNRSNNGSNNTTLSPPSSATTSSNPRISPSHTHSPHLRSKSMYNSPLQSSSSSTPTPISTPRLTPSPTPKPAPAPINSKSIPVPELVMTSVPAPSLAPVPPPTSVPTPKQQTRPIEPQSPKKGFLKRLFSRKSKSKTKPLSRSSSISSVSSFSMKNLSFKRNSKEVQQPIQPIQQQQKQQQQSSTRIFTPVEEDVDHSYIDPNMSLPSISKIDSSKIPDDELGYISTIAGVNETSFFQKEIQPQPHTVINKLTRKVSFISKHEPKSHLEYDEDIFSKYKLPEGPFKPKHITASTSSSCIYHNKKNANVKFADSITNGITFSSDIYDRSNPDMKKVYIMMNYYPREMRAIRIEINDYKINEMIVDPQSSNYTHLFLV